MQQLISGQCLDRHLPRQPLNQRLPILCHIPIANGQTPRLEQTSRLKRPARRTSQLTQRLLANPETLDPPVSFPPRYASNAPPLTLQTAESAAAARRKAILAELGGGASAPTSPRLPSGGVQGVAIRATANLVTHGSNLDIDNTASDQYAGFSSARGVKRNG